MPTYEYFCQTCGHRFEYFDSITAKPLRKCPQCNALALKRLIGAGAGLLFKGSGFYQTDYRTESYTKALKSEKSKVDTAASKSGSSTTGTAPKDGKKT